MFAMYTPWETLENLWFTLPQFTLHLYNDNDNEISFILTQVNTSLLATLL